MGRRGFTLIELLLTIAVIGIMATMIVMAVGAAQESAKIDKTKHLIARLDAIVRAKYESYKARRVQVNIVPPFGANDPRNASFQRDAAQIRLDLLRDLMRMELPDRWSDVSEPPYSVTVQGVPYAQPRPATSSAFYRKWQAGSPSLEVQNAECLYMIVMAAMAENDADSRGFFRPDDVKDTDGDGYPEFVDAFGTPIRFLRWAPGFLSDLQIMATATIDTNPGMSITSKSPGLSTTAGAYKDCVVTEIDIANRVLSPKKGNRVTNYTYNAGNSTGTFMLDSMTSIGGGPTPFAILAPDPLDYRRVDATRATPIASFALYPLIYSAGPDKVFSVVSDFGTSIKYTTVGMNPFISDASGNMVGTQKQQGSDPPGAWADNIHNHQIAIK